VSVAVEQRRRGPSTPRRPFTASNSVGGERLRDAAAVGIPTALALILCLYDLSTRNLWLDEAATVSIVSQHGAAFGAALAHDGGNMLGYYGLLHVLVDAFGHGTALVRLPSALAATATVTITCLIARRLFDRRVTLLSGLLAAVSLSLVYWGQVARGYTVMIALLCASFLLLVIALERPKAGWGLWLAYVAVSTAAVYAGLEAVLVFPVQVLVIAWHRRRIVWLFSALAATAACCIPLMVLATERGSSQIFWIPLPNAFTVRQVLLTLSSGGLEPQFYSASGNALRYLTEALVGVGALAVLWQLLRGPTRTASWRPVLVLGWLVLPGVLAYVISELGHSMFEARYLLMSLPAVALLLAWMIVGLWDMSGRAATAASPAATWLSRRPAGGIAVTGTRYAARTLAIALPITLLTLRAVQLSPSYGVSTEPWRAATQEIVRLTTPGDCVAFYPLDSRMPFRYYLPAGEPLPRPVLPAVPWSQVRPYVEDYATLSQGQIARLPSQCRRVWLVASHQGHHDGTSIGTTHYNRYVSLKDAIGRQYHQSVTATYGAASIITINLFSGPRRHKPARHAP
jgi:4-amino-4-deoxy-L-arabinose transferase-like glycosyltransferase